MTKQAKLMSLAAIAALSLLNARAEDGGSAYDAFPLTAASNGSGYEAETLATCAEAKGDAWFARQLERTDGDVDPTVPAVACRSDNDMIAKATEQDE